MLWKWNFASIRLFGLGAVLLVAVASGCDCGGAPVASICVDEDEDGVDSCSDCNDGDPAVGGTRTDACDGRDNDCDGEVDEDCITSCRPGQAPVECGVAGAGCTQSCQEDGTLAQCQPPTGPVDVTSDIGHCGECGRACDVPRNAEARCVAGTCGRGPCAPFWFDLDPAIFGCETECRDGVCRDPDGNPIPLTSPPLPESGLTWTALASGSSVGVVQTTAEHSHVGILGESTPPAVDGVTIQSTPTHRHAGGFMAVSPL